MAIAAAKRYWLPLVLFALGFFFQLVVLPRSFPPSHYDVLGLKRNASIEEVGVAYDELSSKLFSELDPPVTTELVKIRYAFELLTNPLWKRDYDLFGIDEQLHVIDKVVNQYGGETFSKIDLPLINASLLGLFSDAPNKLTPEEVISVIGKSKPLLIQVYSLGSPRCAQFIGAWKMIGSLLEGVAQTGMVELGDVQLASYLAETMFTKQPYFRKGLPALVAFPPNCSNANCYVRYDGQFSVDAIVDWMATDIIGLPRILYHSKESLAKFIVTSGRHKVKVICFSKTGERAAPFIRKAAIDYQAEASFAFVLFKELEFSLWWNMFGVESVPAFVFLKDTYSKPFVYHGALESSQFQKIMEDYKQNELPQLRSVTSMELGCDARGFSRAGNDTLTWYCLVLVGRAGRTMAQMRETMYRVRDMLMTGDDSDYARKVNASVPMVAATAVKENRLTFTWLDGDVQLKYCQFFLDSEFYKSCGPRRYENDIDVPQIFIVRYLRNSTEDNVEADKWKHFRDQYMGKDANAASQLIARYTGSDDVKETFTSPELVAEDSATIWSKSRGILPSRESIKRKLKKLYFYISDLVTDPRIGPSFLLGACLSFATIWLQKNRTIQSAPPGDDTTDSARRPSNRKARARRSTHGVPSSITDEEPKDARQLLSSGSDSE